MPVDQLASHKRMRACLVGILDLDPTGVARRIEEMDREIAHLEALLGGGTPSGSETGVEPATQVPLSAFVKVA